MVDTAGIEPASAAQAGPNHRPQLVDDPGFEPGKLPFSCPYLVENIGLEPIRPKSCKDFPGAPPIPPTV